MNKEQMNSLVNQQMDTYNHRNVNAFCKCYYPALNVRLLMSDLPRDQGIAVFRESYRKLFESAPQLKCELKSRIVLDTAVIDEEWVTARRGYVTVYTPLRTYHCVHTTAIYRFLDHFIDRVWFAR